MLESVFYSAGNATFLEFYVTSWRSAADGNETVAIIDGSQKSLQPFHRLQHRIICSDTESSWQWRNFVTGFLVPTEIKACDTKSKL